MRLSKLFKLIVLSTVAIFNREFPWISPASDASGTVKFTKGGETGRVTGHRLTPWQPCDEFQPIHGRASTTTMFWFLGYDHANAAPNRCLEQLTANNMDHTVYVEGTEYGETVSCEKAGITPKVGRTCIGWDNLKIAHHMLDNTQASDPKLVRHFLKEITGSIKKFTVNKKFHEQEFLLELKRVKGDKLKELSSTEDPQIKLTLRSFITAAQLIFDGRKSRIAYSNIVADYDKAGEFHLEGHELMRYREDNVERNKGLVKMFLNHNKKTLGIAVAGHAHLTPENEYDLGGSLNTQEALEQSGYKDYAILIMKKS